MKQLTGNARALALRKQLAPELTGADEVAALDRVLHLAEKARVEFEKFKRDLVVLVRNQLQDPLLKLHDTLEALATQLTGVQTLKLEHQVQAAIGNTNRIMKLVDDLLNVQVIETGTFNLQLRTVPDRELIDDAVKVVDEMAKKGAVAIEVVTTGRDIECDKERLVQVIVNFLSNAIKFSKAGQTVTVRALLHDQEIEIQVVDQGRGMPADFIANRLFQLYSQADADDKVKRGGTGLGLYIAKKIVEEHSGQIGANSVEGAGSTFWFRVPLVAVVKLPVSLPQLR